MATQDRKAPGGGALSEPDAAGALDGLQQGLFISDRQGRLTYVNPALRRYLGAGPGVAPSGAWGTLFVEESRRRLERDGLAAVRGGGHWRGRVELRAAEGATLPGLLSLSRGGAGGFVGLFQPVEADDALPPDSVSCAEARDQRMTALRRLAGDMAHDMNNVLTSIVGYARFLSEDLPAGSQQHGFAEQIAVAAGRAKRLVDDALAFARPGRGERRAVPVGPLVEQACAALRGGLPAGAALRAEGAGEPAVAAEPTIFAEVVRHLLANGVEALEGRGGTVEIGWRECGAPPPWPGPGQAGMPARIAIARRPGDGGSELGGRLLAAAGAPLPGRSYLELVVRDSGAGMTEQVLEHVFEPFFTTRQPARGRGLGLSMAFGQVLGEGGALLIDTAPGAGTTVTLLWPAAAGAGPQEASGEPTAPAVRGRLPKGRGQSVLVAEDDRELREALGEMLQRLGYRPVLAEDGEAARKVLEADADIAALLTDRRMPQLSGPELIDWMRAQGLGQPVLLYTGYGEDLDAARLARAGGVSVLSKPIGAATLAHSLAQLLAGPDR